MFARPNAEARRDKRLRRPPSPASASTSPDSMPVPPTTRMCGGMRLSTLAFALFPDVVDDAPGLGFLGGHEAVAVEHAFDGLERLAGVLGVELVQALLGLDDVLGVPLDVRGLAGEAARGLVHHDPGVRQGDP